jgi:hypothetical protein
VTIKAGTSATTANNGVAFTDPSKELGGDVGGCIEPTSKATVLGEHENVAGGCAK